MRREYGHARSLAIAQAQVLCAHDELKMATTRLHVSENENEKAVDALSRDELPSASVQYSDDKFSSLTLLSRVKGKLRYLKVQQTQPSRKFQVYDWLSSVYFLFCSWYLVYVSFPGSGTIETKVPTGKPY